MRFLIGTAALLLLLGTTASAYAQQDEKQKQQQEKPQQAQLAKQQQQQHAQQAKPAQQQRQQHAQQAQPAQQQRTQQASRSQQGNRVQQGNAGQNQQRAQQPQRDAGNRGGNDHGRISDDHYRASFGSGHSFHVNRGDYDNRRFEYGGYSFGFIDPWPVGWYYTDDVYVDYIDGGYYMYDRFHPGLRISISIL